MGNQVSQYKQIKELIPKNILGETVGAANKQKNLKVIRNFLLDVQNKSQFIEKNAEEFNKLVQKYLTEDIKLLSQKIFKCAKLLGKIVPYVKFLLFFLDLQIQDSKQSTQVIVNKAIIKRFSDEYIYILTEKKKMIELCTNKSQWQHLILRCYEVVFFVQTRFENNVFDDWKQLKPKQHIKKLFQVVSSVIFMKHIIHKVCKDKGIAKGQQWKRVTSLVEKLIQHILKVRGDSIASDCSPILLVQDFLQERIIDHYQKIKNTFYSQINLFGTKTLLSQKYSSQYKQKTLNLWKKQLEQLNKEQYSDQ